MRKNEAPLLLIRVCLNKRQKSVYGKIVPCVDVVMYLEEETVRDFSEPKVLLDAEIASLAVVPGMVLTIRFRACAKMFH